MNWSQSQIQPVTDRRGKAVSWKAMVLTPAEHISMYYDALDILKHFSLCSLEVRSTKGICLLIMFLWAAWVICEQFSIHCCIPLLLYFLEDSLDNTRKKMTVIKVKLQYAIAILWTIYTANMNRLGKKINSTGSIQKKKKKQWSSASKTISLTGMLLNNSMLHLCGL